MRNGEDYAVAVRRSDGSITVKKEKYKGFFADSPLKKIPFYKRSICLYRFNDSWAEMHGLFSFNLRRG